MAVHDIVLNGNTYALTAPIQRYRIPQQLPGNRDNARFLRANDPKLEPYSFSDWSGGFGTPFIRPGHDEDLRGFFDSECNTMWRQGIVLPLVPQDITEPDYPNTNRQVTCSTIFGGATWAGFTPNTAADANENPLARNFSGSAWQGGGVIVGNDTGWLYDLISAGDRMYCILGIDPNDHILRYSLDGVTWYPPSTTAVTLNLLTDHEVYDGAKLAWDGLNVVVALSNQVAGTIDIQVSTDGGNTWGNPAGGAISVDSGGGPNGLQAYLDTGGSTAIYLGTREGLWLIDLAAASAELLISMPTASENCRRMAVHNASLYIPVDHGADSPFGMKKLTVGDTGRLIEDVGLDTKQGIPANMLGAVLWMRSIGPWLFASVEGLGSGRHARIINITGIQNEGWENVYKWATESNDPIAWFEGSGNDLIFQEGGFAKGLNDTGDTKYLKNLFLPPNSGATFIYDTPKNFELPEVGGDAPEEPGGFFKAALEAQNLTDGDSIYVDFEWGLNGAAPSAPSPDVRFDDSNRTKILGDSSRGLSGRTIRPNLEFVTGDASISPLVRELAVLFRKRIAPRYGYILSIDINATMDARRGYEAIVAELNTIDESAILVPILVGQDTEREVELQDMTFAERVTGHNPQSATYRDREGVVTLWLEELV